jgi:hypothetical protein
MRSNSCSQVELWDSTRVWVPLGGSLLGCRRTHENADGAARPIDTGSRHGGPARKMIFALLESYHIWWPSQHKYCGRPETVIRPFLGPTLTPNQPSESHL